ncbi:NINE protein [Sphingosinicella soli]|uniref:Ribosomal protein S27E n=1 Tax=Sphingosinicella soli TaxID=333708 RepID=A0A7W7F9T6_9SPHN|nr:NINE protein [Sphingosinicella soli]MBB4632978.1 ribosomal protein S27E [Sphingosinicella soli]
MQTTLAGNMVHCRECGTQIARSAPTCPKCGGRQSAAGGKSKVVAGILAILLGGLGIHRFYLGQGWGIFYLLFCWTFVPSIIAFFEGIVFLLSSDDNWNAKYGG